MQIQPRTALTSDDRLSPDQKIAKARTYIMINAREFGPLLAIIPCVPDPEFPTCYVNGRVIGYNPEFIASLTVEQVTGLLIHELEHVRHLHPFRRGNRDPKIWNLATDKAINGPLRERVRTDPRMDLPADGTYPEPGTEWDSAETHYHRMVREQETPPPPEGPGGRPCDDGESGESGESGEPGDQDQDQDDGESKSKSESESEGEGEGEGEKDGESEDTGSDNEDQDQDQDQDSQSGDSTDGDSTDGDSETKGTGKPWGECRDYPGDPDSGESAETQRQQMEQQIIAAVQIGEYVSHASGGESGAAGSSVISRTLDTPGDFRGVLALLETEKSIPSFSRPSRRYLSSGLYMPGPSVRITKPIVFAIDTSGSIDLVLLKIAVNAVSDLCMQCEPERVTVLRGDTRLRGEPLVYTMADFPLPEIEMLGGGGTDLRWPFDWVETDGTDIHGLIYFTDLCVGEYGLPKQDPGYPVIWLSTSNPDRGYAKRPSFGHIAPLWDQVRRG